MKIQIDTDNKTIKVEKSVNLGEFIDYLDKLLPNEEWRGFKLETNVEIKFRNPQPIYVEPYNPPNWPRPYWPWITYSGRNTNELSLNSGTYNVEVKTE